jgi:asparagine synthase (glutamine-hydrolysing)
MAVELDHRGPDDSGVEIEGNVGLVNARLAILDPGAHGHQPMSDAGSGWTLTYNGEIFNHLELRAELSDRRYRGHSDTETVLHALAEWGVGLLGRINGFFSFAALDGRGRRLLLARDRFGVKPLYVARINGEIWFASEMRVLLAGGVPARPRRDILAHAATRNWPYGRSTPLESIERLLPGTIVEIDTETLQLSERRWFEPADYVDPEIGRELAATPRRELSDRLEQALRASIRRRMVADVPVGAMCSGGLDSTLVTALMRDEDPSLIAFTASLPDERREDEHRWAQRAAQAFDCELDTVTISSQDWRAALVSSIRHHEYPTDNPSSVGISLIAARARDRGVHVLLTGEAADELFCGYPRSFARHRALLPVWRRLERATRGRSHRIALTARAYGVRGAAEIATRRLIEPLSRRDGRVPELPPGAAEVSTYVGEVSEMAARAYGDQLGPRADFAAAQLAELSTGAFPYLLNRQDKDAMSASVETRLPFLDPAVLGLAVNLPVEARIGPRPKGILSDVAARHIPAKIVKRPKQAGMFFDSRDARARVIDAAHPEFLERGVLRDALRIEDQRWRRLISGTTDGRTTQRLWTAEIWCRLFLEDHDVPRVEQDLWVEVP